MRDNIINGFFMNFIHFDTLQECIDFIKFYELKYKIKITHTCCSGKGCCLNKSFEETNAIKNEYITSYIKPDNAFNESIIDECDICYEKKELINLCKICNHPFCMDCIRQINNNNCAYCRSYIDFIVI